MFHLSPFYTLATNTSISQDDVSDSAVISTKSPKPAAYVVVPFVSEEPDVWLAIVDVVSAPVVACLVTRPTWVASYPSVESPPVTAPTLLPAGIWALSCVALNPGIILFQAQWAMQN